MGNSWPWCPTTQGLEVLLAIVSGHMMKPEQERAELFPMGLGPHPSSYEESQDSRIFHASWRSRVTLGPELWVMGSRGSRWDAAEGTIKGDMVRQPYTLCWYRDLARICAGASCYMVHSTGHEVDGWGLGM